ncbi:hypothetical protein EHI8A_066740 [Entamoeba histolytica HM-1:IMSS-B]|uniref:Uncharacterized protein n=7 Tax=Entamoeba TaxID=5758 RepID=B1N3L5_ENTH1|nr:hypothetical protein EHI_052750 [Entamoeba histolytica HM-1:IMSS]XP_008860501.1 hypothetical protein ENU1_206910 [Entamoeba nuttalli P19]EMD48399.1 Hypothetical protein EHI5A_103750 [Entamoeba histolytica KU27]EMH76098.1 hypothetical protein EHI8A_066740 [Entamoeba histolytica HM-1:IMSS-B]EMS14199.1 hypothetical protein KM1_125250 [Entamoeba histolytica HM-3:IMSS]ENY61943.1 hypothetical protein EHI7A_064160 [Entamoeba histolytica HM-1:IMSS-A]GAT95975.1 hypothetical protein CL6EHI_052750 [E|eukprot:XP_008860501.1 hypothetical protein ENU1_206910 [Entamoeba nuttalli P19]
MEQTQIEPPFQREMRGVISTAIDENIDALEETLIDIKVTSANVIYNAIDSYADYISSILDNKITELMNHHLGSEDTTPITPLISIEPIIEELNYTMNATNKKEVQPQQNISMTKKINDLLLNDLKETEQLFIELETHFH